MSIALLLIAVLTIGGLSACTDDSDNDSESTGSSDNAQGTVVLSTVNDEPIYLNEFEPRLEAEAAYLVRLTDTFNAQFGSQATARILPNFGYPPQASDPAFVNDEALFKDYVLSQLEMETLLQQEAEKRGISVTQADVDAELSSLITSFTGHRDPALPTLTPTMTLTVTPTPRVSPTNTPGPSPVPGTPLPTLTATPTPDTAQIIATRDAAADDLWEAAANREGFEDMLYYRALQTKMIDVFRDDLPTEARYVTVRFLLIAPEGRPATSTFDPAVCESASFTALQPRVDTVLAGLENGTAFGDLASQYSDDPSASRDGLLSRSPLSNFVEEFASVVENMAQGEVVGPVCSRFGWFFVEMLANNMLPVVANTLNQQAREVYNEWWQDIQLTATIERPSDWLERTRDEVDASNP